MTKKSNLPNSDRRWAGYITSFLIGVIVTSIPVGYQYIMSQPKLMGRIVTVAYGQINDARISAAALKSMTMYVYLANAREIPVSAVDYSLDINIDGNWKRMKLLYNRFENIRLGFEKQGPFGENSSLIVPSDNALLLHLLGKPIRRDEPIGGLLIFVTPENYDLLNISRIRLRVYDGFGNSHTIEQEAKIEHDPQVLLRLVPGIKIEKIN